MTYRGRNPHSLAESLGSWLADRVKEAGAEGVVLGLSGGIDSAVAAGIATRALGPENVIGVIMPIGNVPEDEALARDVASAFGHPVIEPELLPAFESMKAALDAQRGAAGVQHVDNETEQLAAANLKPRLRMIAVYYYANLLNLLVLGTGNKAELTVGYFTKYGDAGVDLLLLGDLTKEEVRGVAAEIGVPRPIIDRPPSAGLWVGQTDEQELGVTYDQLDQYLRAGSSGSDEADAIIRRRNRSSEHKRALPPIARPG